MHEDNENVLTQSNSARYKLPGKNPEDMLIKSSYTNKTRNGTYVLILCHELTQKKKLFLYNFNSMISFNALRCQKLI